MERKIKGVRVRERERERECEREREKVLHSNFQTVKLLIKYKLCFSLKEWACKTLLCLKMFAQLSSTNWLFNEVIISRKANLFIY